MARVGIGLSGLAFSLAPWGQAGAQARVWVQHGPGPITLGQVENIADREVAGAVNVIAAHPTDSNTVYIGAVNGGIWKTTNAMAATPRWVEQPGTGTALSIGALEFDPTDPTHQTLVAGAGRSSSLLKLGGELVGLWRTTDGGANWATLPAGGALNGLNISGLAPRGATIVVSVDTAEDFDYASLGIWRSTDGGVTFTRVSEAAGTGLPNGGAFDLASDPVDPARLFTNAIDGIYRSTDTGATWTRVSDAALSEFVASAGRVRIAVGTTGNVYVAIADRPDPRYHRSYLAGLFRSGDGGSTWTPLELPQTIEHDDTRAKLHVAGQANLHLSLAADPTDPFTLYIGGDRQPYRSELSDFLRPWWPNSIGAMDYSGRLFRVDASQPEGGQATHLTHSNTSSNSAPHADSRDMAFAANGDLLEVDDGGVYRRTSPRTNAGDWFSLNGDLVVTEIHSVAWDSNAGVVIAGTQDTGTPQQQRPGSARFQSVSTGDGGDVAVDDFGTPGVSVRYSSTAYLKEFRRERYDAANTLIDSLQPLLRIVNGAPEKVVGELVAPVTLNAVVPRRLVIAGKHAVYESEDQGDNVTEISPRIVVNATGNTRIPGVPGGDPIAYGAAGNPDMLYVGSLNRVWVRTEANPAPLVPTNYRGRGWVLGIVMDPANPRIAYVIDGATVSRTADAGATWTNVTGNLHALAPGNLLSLAYSTSTAAGMLVVGTRTGVFAASGPDFSAWSPAGEGLPRVPVLDLDYDPADEILVAGTLGRGAWTLDLRASPPGAATGNGSRIGPQSARTDVESAGARQAGDRGGEVPPEGAAPRAVVVERGEDGQPTERPAALARAPAARLAGRDAPVQGQNGNTSFELRPGVVVHRGAGTAYVTSRQGGIEAVDLATGRQRWHSNAAAKPLAVVRNRLVGQAEPSGAAGLALVTLNIQRGTRVETDTVPLPAGVQATLEESPSGDFETVTNRSMDGVEVSWEFTRHPRGGIADSTVSSNKGELEAASLENAVYRGGLKLHLTTGVATRLRGVSVATLAPREVRLTGGARLLPDSGAQFVSSDERHVLVSRLVADDLVWNKYRWTIYEAGTLVRVGETRSHVSYAPFAVQGNVVIYVTEPYGRQGRLPEPTTLRAFSLISGEEVWSVPLRELEYRGPRPP